MFGIGTGELMIIALVALIVLGPERLPKAARFAGLWVRRARAQWYSVKSELERELAAEELKRSVQDARRSIEDVGTQLRDAEARARAGLDGVRKNAEGLVADAARMPGDAPADARDGDATSDVPPVAVSGVEDEAPRTEVAPPVRDEEDARGAAR